MHCSLMKRTQQKQGNIVDNLHAYFLRPEMAESVMYLARATDDPIWTSLGAQFVASIQHSTWTPCGYAVVQNVSTHALGMLYAMHTDVMTCPRVMCCVRVCRPIRAPERESGRSIHRTLVLRGCLVFCTPFAMHLLRGYDFADTNTHRCLNASLRTC